MKTDVLLVPMGATYARMRAAAVAAEEAGFDGVWTWDHLRDPDQGVASSVLEVWTVLSALAEVTRRISLGPLVLNVSSRHPGLLANMAASLQEVSGGRLLLGLGAGANRQMSYATEYAMLGLAVEPDGVRAQRVAEAIEVMRRLWNGDENSFGGTYYRLARPSGYLRPDPPPPVIVGGFGPRMAAIAGRHADGLNTQAAHPQLADLVRIARDEHARAGRDPDRFIVTVFAGFTERWLRPDSPERARLAKLSVQRLILLLQSPYDEARLKTAGTLMREL
jgi:alkanesulfonate monooxygenase SsuD/methylene tetrahydromethanopterin reductase-like flavin-dependent oxidoreductase (luciferase family)